MKVTILCGIPNSGKSTYAKKQASHTLILSCDGIRKSMYGGYYKFDSRKEEAVWDTFYKLLEVYGEYGQDMIIDNTNCRQVYINKIVGTLPKEYEVEIKYFDIPLWKAHVRNVIRYFREGKWIPIKVMNNMYKNYKKLRDGK